MSFLDAIGSEAAILSRAISKRKSMKRKGRTYSFDIVGTKQRLAVIYRGTFIIAFLTFVFETL